MVGFPRHPRYDVLGLAASVDDDVGFGDVEIERSPAEAPFPQLARRRDGLPHDGPCLLRNRGPVAVDEPLNLGVGEPRSAADQGWIHSDNTPVAVLVHRHLTGDGQPRLTRNQRAQPVGQTLRKHRQHLRGQVAAGATRPGLTIQCRARLDVPGDVGDRYPDSKPLPVLLDRDGVVEVTRVLTVDGDVRALAQVPAVVGRQCLLRIDVTEAFCLGDHVSGEIDRQAQVGDGHLQLGRVAITISQALDHRRQGCVNVGLGLRNAEADGLVCRTLITRTVADEQRLATRLGVDPDRVPLPAEPADTGLAGFLHRLGASPNGTPYLFLFAPWLRGGWPGGLLAPGALRGLADGTIADRPALAPRSGFTRRRSCHGIPENSRFDFPRKLDRELRTQVILHRDTTVQLADQGVDQLQSERSRGRLRLSRGCLAGKR